MLELKKQHLDGGDVTRPDARVVSEWSGQARERAVQGMFTAIARWYDLNNTVLSFGLHRRWKRVAAALVPPLPQGRAVDIGAGTGDLALLLARRFGASGHVAGVDLNAAMLREGSGKVRQEGFGRRVTLFRGNGESLGFRSDSFDAATAGFCMRNVGNLDHALREIRRVLKPGGRFICLEFSRPVHGGLRRLYDWYSFRVLPWIGTKVAGDHTGVYEYLPASIRAFPDQEGLSRLMRDAGFRSVEYRNLSGGIVAIHVAVK